MVANLTVGKKGYEEFSDQLSTVRDRLLPLRERFVSLIDEDAESFKQVMAAYKRPKMTEAEKQERNRAISEALKVAAETPLRTMKLALDVLELCRPIVEYGNKSSITDAGVGTMNLDACFRGARLNVLTNLGGIRDEAWVAAKRETMDEMASETDAMVKEYTNTVAKRMGD
jgi:formiminotetrahydrofolate cyclodeaminase